MFKKLWLIALASSLIVLHSPAQTTNGLMTGTITDSSGAVVPGAQIDLTNQVTGQLRTAITDSTGSYVVPQLSPGIYGISVKKQGFATENRPNVRLQVNQSATLNFQLTVSSTQQTVQVTGAPPPLNTSSATLSDVVGHQETVDLPLNGREFTQLTLLTPGATPIQNAQQASYQVSLGAGGISPSVNGQRGEQNNFTMDGLLNNELFTNVWAISPPPDALQEFNVQSHITDAQFAISSGANINVVTRSGTDALHGSAWEFARNAALDAQGYFNATHLPYSQNQYGVYLGGPVLLPHFNGRGNTWFSAYWEGFRSSRTLTTFADTLTSAMRTGDFSALLGKQVGVDDLGRSEYANEIYDPATSRLDPKNSAAVIRDPFPGNIIPASRINFTAPVIVQKYYPAPNLNVAAGVLPNLSFPGTTAIASDITGLRIDHRFRNNDSLFGRYNRSNANESTPEALPGYINDLLNYSENVAVGYTHLFGASTLLNLAYGWSNMNLITADQGAGRSFTSALGFSLNGNDLYGPSVNISNGYSGVSQLNFPLGPERASDTHADLSKVIGRHTLGIGGMWYHIRAYTSAVDSVLSFTQNATAQGATSGPTGYGPASFMLGLPDSITGYTGDTTETFTTNWYGGYAQDQWKVSKRTTITAGLRYDYVSPANPDKVLAGLDLFTGKFIVTGPVPPLFPEATGRSTFFNPQYDGLQPRFGVAYQAADRTVLRAALAILDDHNNELVQQSENLRLGWPSGGSPNVTLQNRDVPNLYTSALPPESSFIDPAMPRLGQSADPNMRIPYSMEYNFGVEQQLPGSLLMKLDYVGSLGRHQYLQSTGNTATILGPGSLASRGQPFTEYGGSVVNFGMDAGSASYNALQGELKKSLSSGLFFIASYTWSKSLDTSSDPHSVQPQNFYDLAREWGPSVYDVPQLFVFSGLYALPVGRDRRFLPNPSRVTEGLLGNWNIGGIFSSHSGLVFNCGAGGDIANAGGGAQRCNRVGDPYAGAGFQQTKTLWLNNASFTTVPYTFGMEGRDDLRGPSFNNIDFNVFKNVPLSERVTLQIRSDFFDLFNHTNFAIPTSTYTSAAFGKITSSDVGREIQFAVKVIF